MQRKGDEGLASFVGGGGGPEAKIDPVKGFVRVT